MHTQDITCLNYSQILILTLLIVHHRSLHDLSAYRKFRHRLRPNGERWRRSGREGRRWGFRVRCGCGRPPARPRWQVFRSRSTNVTLGSPSAFYRMYGRRRRAAGRSQICTFLQCQLTAKQSAPRGHCSLRRPLNILAFVFGKYLALPLQLRFLRHHIVNDKLNLQPQNTSRCK